MRAGACTVQQALTTEATTLVKQSVCLARRRGHVQVTPLHVASTMLSSPTGLLRAACLLSHSHPLQCKALELCFNVALNRLPATSSSIPILGHNHLHAHYHPPTISNALVAAFKRAQAHQRRGLVESQQQPLLTAKIEVEQLIISILDDPSVSRVMREAGFSSTQVKTNLEKAIPSDNTTKAQGLGSEDMMSTVLEILAGRKKRSIVVVRESLQASQADVGKLMDMVNKGEVPESLRGIQFINIVLSTFVSMRFDEVQRKVAELRRHARSCCLDRGAVLYIGDLNWTAEYWNSSGEKRRCSYCPIDNVLREISKLVFGELVAEIGNGDLWLLSAATSQGYMRCRSESPSLDILLGLHPLTTPAGSSDVILNHNGDTSVLRGSKSQEGAFFSEGPNFQSETHSAVSASSHGPISCKLPSWLQVHQEEKRKENLNDQDSLPPKDQCRYWNFMESPSNNYQRRRLERTLSFSSASPSSSSNFEQNNLSLFHTYHTWPISAPTSRVCSPEHDENRTAIEPNSTSSSIIMHVEYVSRFRELSAHNLKMLCNVLEREALLHKEIIPEIASTILQCRSGMLKRRERSLSDQRKEDTWLLFCGNDCEGKEKIARELAIAVFGLRTSFRCMDVSTFSSEQLFIALGDNPHCVIMVKDVDQLEYESQICIKAAAETGRIRGFSEEAEGFCDAIIILCCDKFETRSRAQSPVKQIIANDEDKEEESEEIRGRACLDLNLAVEDDDMNNCQFDDLGLLEAVDGVFILRSA